MGYGPRGVIRGFKSDPVPKEILEKVLEAVRHSPSAGNSQPFIIRKAVYNADKKVKINI